jgi:hypothetical protein
VDERAQPAIGGHDLLGDGRPVLRGEGIAHAGVEALGEILDGLPEEAGRRVVDDLLVELRQHPLHQHPGLRDASCHALAHVGDGRVHPDHEAVDAPEEVLVVARCLERMVATSRADDRKAARPAAPDLVDGQQVPGKAEAVGARLQPEGEDAVRHALVLGQGDGIDPA